MGLPLHCVAWRLLQKLQYGVLRHGKLPLQLLVLLHVAHICCEGLTCSSGMCPQCPNMRRILHASVSSSCRLHLGRDCRPLGAQHQLGCSPVPGSAHRHTRPYCCTLSPHALHALSTKCNSPMLAAFIKLFGVTSNSSEPTLASAPHSHAHTLALDNHATLYQAVCLGTVSATSVGTRCMGPCCMATRKPGRPMSSCSLIWRVYTSRASCQPPSTCAM